MSPKDWKEARRLRAWELHQQGWSQVEIAKVLGVTCGALSQWVAAARQRGPQALWSHPASGRPPKLRRQQLARLPELLARGATAYGFRGEVWTCTRVAALIERVFGVQYHRAHVSRLLKAIGWTPQKPIRRARQRDEAAIARWRNKNWSALKKRREKRAELSSL